MQGKDSPPESGRLSPAGELGNFKRPGSPDIFDMHTNMLKQLVAQNQLLSEQVASLTKVVESLVEARGP